MPPSEAGQNRGAQADRPRQELNRQAAHQDHDRQRSKSVGANPDEARGQRRSHDQEETDRRGDEGIARLPAQAFLNPLAQAARQRGEAQHERKHHNHNRDRHEQRDSSKRPGETQPPRRR